MSNNYRPVEDHKQPEASNTKKFSNAAKICWKIYILAEKLGLIDLIQEVDFSIFTGL
jgi:hypothetical protein